MRVLALLFLLCAGCATMNGGGGAGRSVMLADSRNAASVVTPAAPADSLTLRWTLPTRGAIGCWADPASRVYDRQRWSVLRLKGQAAAWRPGCEAVVACWDSVRAQTVPDTVMSQYGWPGDTIRVRVARGYEYTVVARNSRGWNCWGRIVR